MESVPFDFEAFKKEAMERLKAGKGLLGTEGAFTPLIKTFLEEALEGELETHIDADELPNRKNGKGKKTVKTTHGPVDIETPRDRAGSFDPKILAKRQRQLPSDIERQIFALYARGNSYGDIRDFMEEMYDVEISPATISRITDKVLPLIEEWRTRPLESVYPFVFMDAMGIELEQEAINDTAELLSRTGWKPGVHVKNDYRVTAPGTLHPDTIFTYLRVIRHAPGAVLWERKWTKGVPASWQEAGVYLEKRTGYAFPVLQPVKEARVVRALTTVLRDNLDSQVTVSGLKVKMYAGYVFSTVVANEVLKSEIKNLAVHLAPELDEGKLEQLAKMAQTEVPMDRTTSNTLLTSIQQSFSLTDKEAAAVLLAVAASHSPAQVNDAVMEPVLKVMEPAGIVEINVWLSVLQLLNRLSSYYNLVKGY